jgi:MFS transporter, ACS family, tartrate transporter
VDSYTEKEAFRSTALRIMPFLFLGHLLLHFARLNVGFAALQMNGALGLSPEAFGFSVGIFFVGYALFEIPSNYMLARMGAPLWIARIMITWGIVSAAMGFATNATTFYVLRFMLGAAEAGFTPGALFYLSQWFPRRRFGSVNGLLSMAAPIAGVIVGPVSGMLLDVNTFGIAGWRWMFIVEGIPSILFGVVFYRLLPRTLDDAHWLPDASRAQLGEALSREHAQHAGHEHSDFAQGLLSKVVWGYAATYFVLLCGMYAVFFWMPQIVKSSAAGLSNVGIGWFSAGPFIVAALMLLIVPRLSDRLGDRRWHLVVLATLAGVCLYASTTTSSLLLGYINVLIAVGASFCYLSIFWSGPASALTGNAAAAGFALINCIGNLGGFLGPYVFGVLRSSTGNFLSGLQLFALFFLVSAAIPFVFPKRFPGREPSDGTSVNAETVPTNH